MAFHVWRSQLRNYWYAGEIMVLLLGFLIAVTYASASGRMTRIITIFLLLGMIEGIIARHRRGGRQLEPLPPNPYHRGVPTHGPAHRGTAPHTIRHR